MGLSVHCEYCRFSGHLYETDCTSKCQKLSLIMKIIDFLSGIWPDDIIVISKHNFILDFLR